MHVINYRGGDSGDLKWEKALLWEATSSSSSSSSSVISLTSTILSLRVFLFSVRVLVHWRFAHGADIV